jgi:hypothetical protein
MKGKQSSKVFQFVSILFFAVSAWTSLSLFRRSLLPFHARNVFDNLPDELITKIGDNLGFKEKAILSQTSTKMKSVFHSSSVAINDISSACGKQDELSLSTPFISNLVHHTPMTPECMQAISVHKKIVAKYIENIHIDLSLVKSQDLVQSYASSLQTLVNSLGSHVEDVHFTITFKGSYDYDSILNVIIASSLKTLTVYMENYDKSSALFQSISRSRLQNLILSIDPQNEMDCKETFSSLARISTLESLKITMDFQVCQISMSRAFSSFTNLTMFHINGPITYSRELFAGMQSLKSLTVENWLSDDECLPTDFIFPKLSELKIKSTCFMEENLTHLAPLKTTLESLTLQFSELTDEKKYMLNDYLKAFVLGNTHLKSIYIDEDISSILNDLSAYGSTVKNLELNVFMPGEFFANNAAATALFNFFKKSTVEKVSITVSIEEFFTNNLSIGDFMALFRAVSFSRTLKEIDIKITSSVDLVVAKISRILRDSMRGLWRKSILINGLPSEVVLQDLLSFKDESLVLRADTDEVQDHGKTLRKISFSPLKQSSEQ